MLEVVELETEVGEHGRDEAADAIATSHRSPTDLRSQTKGVGTAHACDYDGEFRT